MIIAFGSEEEASPQASMKPDRRHLVALGQVIGILAIGMTVGWLARAQLRIDPTLVLWGMCRSFQRHFLAGPYGERWTNSRDVLAGEGKPKGILAVALRHISYQRYLTIRARTSPK